jgi:ribonuclease HI
MVTIFTDGSSRGNPGPGGWGAIVATEHTVVELGGFQENTTNNRMEMNAIVKALEHIQDSQDAVTIYTDSKYTISGVTSWISGWKKNNWKTKQKTDVLNRDLWESLDALMQGKNIEWKHVSGHVGIPGNERVDTIAHGFASGEEVLLYKGDRKHYSVDLSQTKAVGGSSSKNKTSAKAYSYLSLVEGVLVRHKTWAECEKRVKGVSSKFRKATSPEHEKEILKEWGVVE